MKPLKEREYPLDLIKVSIKHQRGLYSYDAECSLDAQRSFLNWLKIFEPNAYDKFLEPLLKWS